MCGGDASRSDGIGMQARPPVSQKSHDPGRPIGESRRVPPLGSARVRRVQRVEIDAKAGALAHSGALSIAVPSPHSLKLVIRWNCWPDASIAAMSACQRPMSRASRGADSLAFQNPGLMVKVPAPAVARRCRAVLVPAVGLIQAERETEDHLHDDVRADIAIGLAPAGKRRAAVEHVGPDEDDRTSGYAVERPVGAIALDQIVKSSWI